MIWIENIKQFSLMNDSRLFERISLITKMIIQINLELKRFIVI